MMTWENYVIQESMKEKGSCGASLFCRQASFEDASIEVGKFVYRDGYRYLPGSLDTVQLWTKALTEVSRVLASLYGLTRVLNFDLTGTGLFRVPSGIPPNERGRREKCGTLHRAYRIFYMRLMPLPLAVTSVIAKQAYGKSNGVERSRFMIFITRWGE